MCSFVTQIKDITKLADTPSNARHCSFPLKRLSQASSPNALTELAFLFYKGGVTH